MARAAVGDPHAQSLLNTPASPSSASPTRATPAAARSDRRPTSLAGPTRSTLAGPTRSTPAATLPVGIPNSLAAFPSSTDQYALNTAAINGGLGFNAETGRNYLEKRAAAGDQHAKQLLNTAHLHLLHHQQEQLQRLLCQLVYPLRLQHLHLLHHQQEQLQWLLAQIGALLWVTWVMMILMR